MARSAHTAPSTGRSAPPLLGVPTMDLLACMGVVTASCHALICLCVPADQIPQGPLDAYLHGELRTILCSVVNGAQEHTSTGASRLVRAHCLLSSLNGFYAQWLLPFSRFLRGGTTRSPLQVPQRCTGGSKGHYASMDVLHSVQFILRMMHLCRRTSSATKNPSPSLLHFQTRPF